MKEIVADEDIPRPVVEKLRSRDISVFYVEEEMKGSTDLEILETARDRNLPILTFDNDFFEYRNHPGIFFITSRSSYDTVVEAVSDVVSRIKKTEVENTVIRINPSTY